MFPDHVLELWPAPAEQEPSRGCSGTALRKDAAAPPRPLFAGAELGAVSERASPGDLPGGVLAGCSWGGSRTAPGRGVQPGTPPVGARSGRVLLSAALGHACPRAGGLAAGSEVSTQRLSVVDPLSPYSPPRTDGCRAQQAQGI